MLKIFKKENSSSCSCSPLFFQWLSDYPRWLIVSIINAQVTTIIDFIIPADNYNQTLLITCQHYAHGTLYYNIHV
jgi:hypothetical protein